MKYRCRPRRTRPPSSPRFSTPRFRVWMARDHVPGLCIGTASGDDRRLRCYGTRGRRHGAAGGRGIAVRHRLGVEDVHRAGRARTRWAMAPSNWTIAWSRISARGDSRAGPFDGSTVTIRQLLTHTAGRRRAVVRGREHAAGQRNHARRPRRPRRGREPVRLIACARFRVSLLGRRLRRAAAARRGHVRHAVRALRHRAGVPTTRHVGQHVLLGSARATADTAGHDVGGRPLARRSYGAAMAPGAMVTTGDDMMRFVGGVCRVEAARAAGLA